MLGGDRMASLALEHVDAEIDVVDDAEFELDMRVVRTASSSESGAGTGNPSFE